mmetsp:Transcript_16540/g.39767  ORF Transcript_16540/g.39767 Transcript_16540/m.39767 type:complete len:241 (+) Transcript_16540:888-1610(+)
MIADLNLPSLNALFPLSLCPSASTLLACRTAALRRSLSSSSSLFSFSSLVSSAFVTSTFFPSSTFFSAFFSSSFFSSTFLSFTFSPTDSIPFSFFLSSSSTLLAPFRPKSCSFNVSFSSFFSSFSSFFASSFRTSSRGGEGARGGSVFAERTGMGMALMEGSSRLHRARHSLALAAMGLCAQPLANSMLNASRMSAAALAGRSIPSYASPRRTSALTLVASMPRTWQQSATTALKSRNCR